MKKLNKEINYLKKSNIFIKTQNVTFLLERKDVENNIILINQMNYLKKKF